jgi:hypothetical protein
LHRNIIESLTAECLFPKEKIKYITDSGEFALQSGAKYVLLYSNMSVVN